jgi:hypothetical protein
MAGLEPSQEVLESPGYEAVTLYFADSSPGLDGTLNAFCRLIEDMFLSNASSTEVEGVLRTAW